MNSLQHAPTVSRVTPGRSERPPDFERTPRGLSQSGSLYIYFVITINRGESTKILCCTEELQNPERRPRTFFFFFLEKVFMPRVRYGGTDSKLFRGGGTLLLVVFVKGTTPAGRADKVKYRTYNTLRGIS